MIKLYNTQSKIANDLTNFFTSINSNLSKPNLKLISPIILGMIEAESIVQTDIVKKLKGPFSLVQPSSTIRRLERFFNNPKFDVYDLYHSVISHVIKNFKLDDPFVHITFDHMFCNNKFSNLMFSLRIGKQGIPLWFKCFKGNNDPEAFSLDLIKEGILFCYNLFKNKNCDIIFLADRWFNFTDIMAFIDSLNCSYFIRTKTNILIDIPYSSDNDVIKYISDIELKYAFSQFFYDVKITNSNFQTNLTISPLKGHSEPFYILTNSDPKKAIHHYKFRFGSIEFIFKNQKSNGFYLESTKVKNLTAYTSMFGLMCIAMLWLIILGSDYCKNKHSFKNFLKFKISKSNGKSRIRTFSLFNTGLFLFNLVLNSEHKFKLKCSFILYDI